MSDFVEIEEDEREIERESKSGALKIETGSHKVPVKSDAPVS